MSRPERALLVVPAAGRGARLGGEAPKALVDVGGHPLIARVLGAFPDADVTVVVAPGDEARFRRELSPREVVVVQQPAPRGMGDAVERTRVRWRNYDVVIVAWADLVWLTPALGEALVEAFLAGDARCLVPAIERERPYVGLLVDDAGRVERVLEAREGVDTSPARLADAGVFLLSPSLDDAYARYMTDKARGIGQESAEKNFLPFLELLAEDDEPAVAWPVPDKVDLVGVNTPTELARARAAYGTPWLSIACPAFNEGGHLYALLERWYEVLVAAGRPFEIVVVNDGSTDDTAAELDRAAARLPLSVRAIHLHANGGAAAALAHAIAHTRGNVVVTTDSDGQYAIEDALALARALDDSDELDAVCAFRTKKRAPWPDVLGARLSTATANLLLGTDCPDYSCILRAVRGERLRALDFSSTGLNFSVELTHRLLEGGARVVWRGVEQKSRASGVSSARLLRTAARRFAYIGRLGVRARTRGAGVDAPRRG